MGNYAVYDAIADWYAEYVDGTASAFTERVHLMLRNLLPPPGDADRCIDLCCGTGAHARAQRARLDAHVKESGPDGALPDILGFSAVMTDRANLK